MFGIANLQNSGLELIWDGRPSDGAYKSVYRIRCVRVGLPIVERQSCFKVR